MRCLMGMAAASLAVALAAFPARAAVPRDIPFQATVRTAAGAPLADAPIAVTFSVYPAAGGAALWTNTQTLTPSHGVISAQIPVPDSARFDQPYSVGIRVGNDPEMSPRLALAATPYAFSLPNVTVDRATGAVGIGVGPDAAALLTVGGKIHATTGGIEFPDGTLQSTAQATGPQGPAGPRGPRGYSATDIIPPPASGLPGATHLQLVLDGKSTYSVSLCAPLTVSVAVEGVADAVNKDIDKGPGPPTYDPLVVRRPWSPSDGRWAALAAADTYDHSHAMSLRLLDAHDNILVQWDFTQAYLAGYHIRPAQEGTPVEELDVHLSDIARTQNLPRTARTGRPVGGGDNNLLATFNGVKGSALINAPVGNSIIFGRPPGGSAITVRDGDLLTVSVPLNQQPDLFPWFRNAVLGNNVKQAGSVSLNGATTLPQTLVGAWPARYSLIPTQDGGFIEEFQISVDMLG